MLRYGFSSACAGAGLQLSSIFGHAVLSIARATALAETDEASAAGVCLLRCEPFTESPGACSSGSRVHLKGDAKVGESRSIPPSAPVDLPACDHRLSLVHSSVQASGNVRNVREKNEGERTGYAGPFPGDRVTHSDKPSHAPHRRRSCPFSPYWRSPHHPDSAPRDRPLRCPTRPAAGAGLMY